ncbi:hypothetical protein BH23THE1_BH23THE1_08920 [soil metagenome]
MYYYNLVKESKNNITKHIKLSVLNRDTRLRCCNDLLQTQYEKIRMIFLYNCILLLIGHTQGINI